MYRYLLLICVVFGVGLLTTPAPLPRPWFDGWDKPLDPLGNCRFVREGDKLTITVPGQGYELDGYSNRFTAPCLLRPVEGDFSVTVRVGGRICPTAASGFHSAGILLTNGKIFIKVMRIAAPEGFKTEDGAAISPFCAEATVLGGGTLRFFDGNGPQVEPVYLRLVRLRNQLRVAFSEDGKKWVDMHAPANQFDQVKLPGQLKVGVIAESSSTDHFEPWFDQFDLKITSR